MAGAFEDQLRSELTGIQTEIDRLQNKRRLIEELLSNESGTSAPAEPKPTRRRAARRNAGAGAPRRTRRPRGLITSKVREFLGQQREPVHATEILAFLEKNDAAPQSAKPMPTLQSTLQRMKEMGEIENAGRNRWNLRSGSAPASAPASSPVSPPASSPPPAAPATPVRSDGPPVVTSTTTFGSRPQVGQ